MRNILVVTGGAGFIGSNLISELLKFKKFRILSIDNYSSGFVKNHIKNKRVRYLIGSTKNIDSLLRSYNDKIHSIFHFGEFARIYQSFKNINECFSSNIEGSSSVFNFALKNKIRLVYSATSASLGNKGKDMNLSPYAFSKAKNLELLENLKKWFNFRYEVIYFYNVYGDKQICKGDMATVIGIFEDCSKLGKKLPVVRPGTQQRRFTHVSDTVKACIFAWRQNKSKHYSIASKQSYSIVELAKMFKSKIRYLPVREGERFASALTKMNLNNKIIRLSAKIKLSDYINNFLRNND
ncbi:WcaG Nucleoside-diphosphate-sugar epimerases [Candidatus Pelagibacterales bacterium]